MCTLFSRVNYDLDYEKCILYSQTQRNHRRVTFFEFSITQGSVSCGRLVHYTVIILRSIREKKEEKVTKHLLYAKFSVSKRRGRKNAARIHCVKIRVKSKLCHRVVVRIQRKKQKKKNGEMAFCVASCIQRIFTIRSAQKQKLFFTLSLMAARARIEVFDNYFVKIE